MSGYFDALIRSSGLTISRARPTSTQVEPIDVEADRSIVETEANAGRPASIPHEPIAPHHISDAVDVTAPARALGSVDRRERGEPNATPPSPRGATEPAADAPKKPSAHPVESLQPDLGHTLVRAAMRWVAAGTPPVGPPSPLHDVAQGILRRPESSPAVHEHTGTIATKGLHRDDNDASSLSQHEARRIPAPLDLSVEESIAAKPLPIRALLVASAPPAPPASSVRDEVVEVSIGAIHVRVDAPPAQTVARPALTPAGGAPGGATSRPARSALSRRALRRI
jgi:hypothetical protein